MQTLMLRLDGFVRRRRRWVLAAWLGLLLAAAPFAARQSENLSGGGFGAPGSQSQAVADALDRGEFPGVQRTGLAAVLVPRDGATPDALRAAAAEVADAASTVALVEMAAGARRQAAQAFRAADRPVILPLRADVNEDDATGVAADLRKELGLGEESGGPVAIHLVGQGALWAGMQDLSKRDLQSAEVIGFPIILLILLGVFGSLAAASLPMALGFVSVLVTGALIWAVSQAMDMSVFVTNMASMIGIGVAVDYSLFVLARYREEIRGGHDPVQARARAMRTSGLAVVFSGVTVIVSLAGLWMIDSNAIRSMALGAILVVAVSLLGSATLLPALIHLLGRRAYARSRTFLVLELVRRSRARRRPGSTRPGVPPRPEFWERWTGAVMRRPIVAAVASSAVLLTLAVPALSLDFGSGALRQFPEGNETRVGFEAAASVTEPGEATKLRVVVRGDREAAGRVREAVAADPGVARVDEVVRSRDGRGSLIVATPSIDAESDAAHAMVRRLRAGLPERAGPDAAIEVGGVTAAQEDFTDLVSGSMWKVLLFVLGLSYLVLLVLLRSVVLPLKAAVMNLLSVGAAYGVLVAVFQWGWIDGFLGFESPGYIDTLVPPLVLAVVFGLSMDYEVFLLSRIRERFDATGDNRRAVAEGLAGSARTITSAALIMVAVFAVFVGTGVPSIKEIGLGCAVAIALDATLVRLVLVPAAMELMGKWNWYLPAPLRRVLPRSSFEELPADGSPSAAEASPSTA